MACTTTDATPDALSALIAESVQAEYAYYAAERVFRAANAAARCAYEAAYAAAGSPDWRTTEYRAFRAARRQAESEYVAGIAALAGAVNANG